VLSSHSNIIVGLYDVIFKSIMFNEFNIVKPQLEKMKAMFNELWKDTLWNFDMLFTQRYLDERNHMVLLGLHDSKIITIREDMYANNVDDNTISLVKN